MADRNMEGGRMECHHPEREDGMSPPEGEWNEEREIEVEGEGKEGI